MHVELSVPETAQIHLSSSRGGTTEHATEGVEGHQRQAALSRWATLSQTRVWQAHSRAAGERTSIMQLPTRGISTARDVSNFRRASKLQRGVELIVRFGNL